MRVRLRVCLRRGWAVMVDLKDFFGFAIDEGLDVGTHKFDGKGELKGHRFHLRVDSRGKGVLMIDASKLLFLNGTAIDYIRSYLEGWSEKEAARYIRRRYKGVDYETAQRHFRSVKAMLDFSIGWVLPVTSFANPWASLTRLSAADLTLLA